MKMREGGAVKGREGDKEHKERTNHILMRGRGGIDKGTTITGRHPDINPNCSPSQRPRNLDHPILGVPRVSLHRISRSQWLTVRIITRWRQTPRVFFKVQVILFTWCRVGMEPRHASSLS